MKSVSLVSLNLMEISRVRYRIDVRHSYQRSLQIRNWVIVCMGVALGAFVWLAVRNAQVRNCDDITWDQFNNVQICETTLGKPGVPHGSPLDLQAAKDSGGLEF